MTFTGICRPLMSNSSHIDNPERKPTELRGIISLLHKIEDGILITLLLVMILMAVFQIGLRNFFESGILWGDGLVRVLVLWIGLIGAMIASRSNHHISIDMISKFLPAKVKRFTDLLILLFTALICSTMTWYSFTFVAMEKQDGMTAFAQIPAWICESIIPAAFGVISLRYFILFFVSVTKLFRQTGS